MGKLRHIAVCFGALILVVQGCVSRRQVVDDYLVHDKSAARPETLVFFLVDGFSVPLAQKLLGEGRLPEIKSFFLGNKSSFSLGRATFPSLTHVNISSIVTSSNVDSQPIIGNQIVKEGQVLNLESPFSQKAFGELIKPYSIFADLSKQGRSSMSFAPFYGDQATSRYGLDLKMGLAYRSGNYAYVDSELLESMVFTLKKLPIDRWPNFIFVHVIGVDAIEHRNGRLSQPVLDYAHFIDGRLGPVFDVLKQGARSGRSIGAVLTSDHGMSDLKELVAIEDRLRVLMPDATLINQGRLVAVNFSEKFLPEQRVSLAIEVSRLPGVMATVHKTDDVLTIDSEGRRFVLRYKDQDCGRDGTWAMSLDGRPYLCPSELDKITEKFFYPYFATNVSAYFRAKASPDLLVLAREATSFGDYLHAHHGGLSPDEILVPLLFWNLELKSFEKIPPTYRLLQGFRASAQASDGR